LTTLHGRALAFATGIKLANPNLNVIVVTGDGDGSGIGGNHLIHAARRNVELTVVLLNNGVYASTGGQVAPTTPHGAYTPTTPFGNIEDPFDLCKLLEAAGAVYVARWTTYHVRPAIESIKKGIKKKGFSFIEIIGQCPTYLGRYVLKLYEPVECINWFKNNSIRKELIGNLSKEELANKIIVGEFVDKEKIGLVERYQKLYGKI
ncbi:MAG: thiamine pyrophosphate-dependent enzyme, partial [Nitrososphaerales archaeon]